jgi:hypothetical protein
MIELELELELELDPDPDPDPDSPAASRIHGGVILESAFHLSADRRLRR